MKLPVKRLPLPAARTIALTRPLMGTSEQLLTARDGAPVVDQEETGERAERHERREDPEYERAPRAEGRERERHAFVEEGGDGRVGEERREPAQHHREERQPAAPPAPAGAIRRGHVPVLELAAARVGPVPAVARLLVERQTEGRHESDDERRRRPDLAVD